jgi:hypothetical protein
VTLAAVLVACGGDTVSLGQREPVPFHFGEPKLVTELAAIGSSENPTLTADELELYFSSGDLYRVNRASLSAPFDVPELLSALSTSAFETSPAISSDGLTLWFGSDRRVKDHVEVFVSKRASRSAEFEAPVLVQELGSDQNDIPRPLGLHGTTMPLSSARDTKGAYTTYFARFDQRLKAFDAPEPVPELTFAGRSTTDAWLSNDGLVVFFTSGEDGTPPDLYAAFRKSTAGAFSVTEPLTDLNTPFDDRDPFLCADGNHFYFASDRGTGDGTLRIYQAPRIR